MKKRKVWLSGIIGIVVAFLVKMLLSSLLGVTYVTTVKTISQSVGIIGISFDPGWSVAVIIATIWLIGYASGWLTQYFRTKISD